MPHEIIKPGLCVNTERTRMSIMQGNALGLLMQS